MLEESFHDSRQIFSFIKYVATILSEQGGEWYKIANYLGSILQLASKQFTYKVTDNLFEQVTKDSS